jgi:hypothetical protein
MNILESVSKTCKHYCTLNQRNQEKSEMKEWRKHESLHEEGRITQHSI